MIAPTLVDYLIGVDGGGTATRVRLTDAAGRPLGQGAAGPSALRRGATAAWAEIQAALRQAFEAAGLAPAEPRRCAIGLGLAGAGFREWEQAFEAAAPPYARLVLRNDALTAVLGAHGGACGAVLIAGTGSVLAVLDRQRQFRLAGGFGFPVGDEGSGAWIGCQALRLAQRAQDGRAAAGPLAQAVWKRCGRGRRALLAFAAAADATALAALAPLVFEHAQDDKAAGCVLDAAADELALLTQAEPGAHEASHPGTTGDSKGSGDPGRIASAPLPLALAGSVALALAPRLTSRVLPWALVPPQADAAAGAWRLVADPAAAGITEAGP